MRARQHFQKEIAQFVGAEAVVRANRSAPPLDALENIGRLDGCQSEANQVPSADSRDVASGCHSVPEFVAQQHEGVLHPMDGNDVKRRASIGLVQFPEWCVDAETADKVAA